MKKYFLGFLLAFSFVGFIPDFVSATNHCEGLEGRDLACCEFPGTTQCDCYGMTGDELTCCQDPTDPVCDENDYCTDGFCGSQDCDCPNNGDCPVDDPACEEPDYCTDGFCGSQDCGCTDFGDCPEDDPACLSCPDVCDQEDQDCYDFNECCELDPCSDFSCPGYCTNDDGACDVDYCCQSGQITGPDCPEICDDEKDNDDNGLTDCADTTDGYDGCCEDAACESYSECNPEYYGCTDPCADNYDPNADGCEDGTNGCCTYDGNADEYPSCCSDGRDNDGNGKTDSDDFNCMAECQDPCATNYLSSVADNAAHDCSVTEAQGGRRTCECEYDYEKLANGCCEDDEDNDSDGPKDKCEDVNQDGDCYDIEDLPGDDDCVGGGGGTTCPYAFDYQATVDCSNITYFEGAIGYDRVYSTNVICPSDSDAESAAQVLAAQAVTDGGGLCNLSIGYTADYSGSDASYSWAFLFLLTEKDACLNIGGSQATVPPGMEQTISGDCIPIACINGDNDGDGICNEEDPCDNIDDSDLGDGLCAGLPCNPNFERDEAGLISTGGGNCSCGEFTRDLELDDESEDVGALQDFLDSLDYLDLLNDIEIRGVFDIKTRNALRDYQIAAGLTPPSSFLDAETRALINLAIGGPVVNQGVYDPMVNECPPVVEIEPGVCDNLTPDIEDDILEVPAGMIETIDSETGESICTCEGPTDTKICPDGPTDWCITETECCSVDYVFCAESSQCVINDDGYCPDQPDCRCVGCNSTSPGWQCCANNPNRPPWCTTILDTCISSPQIVSACVTAYNNNNAPYQHGSLLAPLNNSLVYTSQQLETIFSVALNAQSLIPAGQRKQIYGKIGAVVQTSPAGSEICVVTPCGYGEDCVNSVDPVTRRVSATCVPCDPCNIHGACYDPENILCPPCDPCDINGLCYNPDASICRENKDVQIFVVPKLIPDGGQCIVNWSSEGMRDCTIVGPGLDIEAGDPSQFAGQQAVSPSGAATYTIECRGMGDIPPDSTDGYVYKKSDGCVVNPNILEF